MNINIFDSPTSIIPFHKILINIRSYIFITETITLNDSSAWANMLNVDLNSISDKMAIDFGKWVYKREKQEYEMICTLEDLLLSLKKIRQVKHKDKSMMLVLGNFNIRMANLKQSLKGTLDLFFDFYKIAELRQFIDDKIWSVPFLSYVPDTKKEDVLLQIYFETFLNRNNIIAMDDKLTEYFTCTMLDEDETTVCDFIKIPLWDIPVAEGLTYNQIKHTRADLKPKMMPFTNDLNELAEAFKTIQFLPKNIQTIKELCRKKLSEHIMPMQQSIDDSLYLSHLRNQSAEDMCSKLFLGIASANMLIDYYEKAEIIQPYVASEIKQRLARHVDLKSCYLFTFMNIHSMYGIAPDTNKFYAEKGIVKRDDNVRNPNKSE